MTSIKHSEATVRQFFFVVVVSNSLIGLTISLRHKSPDLAISC